MGVGEPTLGTSEFGLDQVCHTSRLGTSCFTHAHQAEQGSIHAPTRDAFAIASLLVIAGLTFGVLALLLIALSRRWERAKAGARVAGILGGFLGLGGVVYVLFMVPSVVVFTTQRGFAQAFFGTHESRGLIFTYGGEVGWFVALSAFAVILLAALFLLRPPAEAEEGLSEEVIAAEEKAKRALFLRWLYGNILAFSVLGLLFWSGALVYLGGLSLVILDFVPLGWPLMGAVIGVSQGVVFRGRIPRPARWALATFLGFSVLMVVPLLGGLAEVFVFDSRQAFTLGRGLSAPISIGLMASGGAVVGVAQWLVLRSRTRRSGWWVGASVAAFGLFMASWLAVTQVLPAPAEWSLLLWGPIGGVVVGGITGTTLVKMLSTGPNGRVDEEPDALTV